MYCIHTESLDYIICYALWEWLLTSELFCSDLVSSTSLIDGSLFGNCYSLQKLLQLNIVVVVITIMI